MLTLTGIPVSDGQALAPAVVPHAPTAQLQLPAEGCRDPQAQQDLFVHNCAEFTARLRDIGSHAPDRLRDLYGATAGFLSAAPHTAAIAAAIAEGTSAALACREVYTKALHELASPGDDPAEIADRQELCTLVLEFLASLSSRTSLRTELPELTAPCIVVVHDLTPAQFLSLRAEMVRGVVLEGGSASGHLATLLHELRVPAVFGVIGLAAIKAGDLLLVDAHNGVVTVNPPQTASDTRQGLSEDFSNPEDVPLKGLTIACSVGARGADGLDPKVLHHGLGLLRSEFMFLSAASEPSEEEMTAAFAAVFAQVPQGAPITARTFDFADDKKPRFALSGDDSGPLKGYGAGVGTRLLKKQLRALLLAAPGRKLTIVFPLVTRVSESRYLHALASASKQELVAEGRRHGSYDTALMIETPGSVLAARAFAEHCSMFILGTSSLAEYAAAPRPASTTFTPALAKMLCMAARAAHDVGVPVGIAGRYASRLELLPFYLGLGISHIAVYSYQTLRLRLEMARLCSGTLRPRFDPLLYSRVMHLFSGHELTELLSELSLQGITPAPRAGGAG